MKNAVSLAVLHTHTHTLCLQDKNLKKLGLLSVVQKLYIRKNGLRPCCPERFAFGRSNEYFLVISESSVELSCIIKYKKVDMYLLHRQTVF